MISTVLWNHLLEPSADLIKLLPALSKWHSTVCLLIYFQLTELVALVHSFEVDNLSVSFLSYQTAGILTK